MASLLVGLPLILGVIIFFYYGAKAVSAEYYFKQALDAVNRNDVKSAYEKIAKAIQRNPRVDRYHASVAQLDFLVAQSIVQKKEGDKITDDEKNTISQLIQESISEGKNAVSLNPQRSDNWELLGNLYRQIMAFAQGADQFAIQAYIQAIALNPIDPNLRINLGGIYYAIKDYDSAVRVFELAVSAKPDHANARYNLAIALRESGKLDQAIREMTNVVSLVKKDSQDYQIATSTLTDLQNKKKSEKGAGEELQPPKVKEQKIKPPLELPRNAEPPTPILSSTPTSSPTLTPAPQP